MPSTIAIVTSILFFIAGLLYLINHGIVLRRFQRIHLSLSILRGINFLFYFFVFFAFSFGILAPNLDFATNWYRFLTISFLCTEITNIVYMNYVNFGRFRDLIGSTMVFLAAINFAMLWFPENLIISYVPAFDAFYPALSPPFLFTNLCFGVFHTSLNATANSRVVRRPGMSWQNKIKFVFFTGGIVLFNTSITVALIVVGFFGDYNTFLWTAVCGILAFCFTFTGLFYANTSVFSLPIRLYLLVIFGVRGEIFYEKWFSKRESVTAALLPKAAASIASLVDNAFSQTQRMHLLSLQNRVILYEWKKGMGVMLVADQDSSVFRNSIRQLLHSLEYQQNTKQGIEAQVQEIFNYYPIEYDDNK